MSVPARPKRWPRSSTIRTAFRNAKAVGRYFGLVPCQDQSGDRNRLGHITREGAPVVRQLVAEAAWQARRRSPTVRAYFERAQRDDPQRKKIALVATAHYLVRVMWAMLRHGTVWQENRSPGGVTPARVRREKSLKTRRGSTGSTSRSRAGLRLHPEVRHGALRRRWCEWEQPHTLSWRSAAADDAEWMSGKSRARLAPVLTDGSSWMSDRRVQVPARLPHASLTDLKCGNILFTPPPSKLRRARGPLDGSGRVTDQGFRHDQRRPRRTGNGRRPVPGLAGRLGSDRLAPRSARAVPRAGRPAPSGGALRLPRPGPARGSDQHHAPARPGDRRTRPAHARDRSSG